MVALIFLIFNLVASLFKSKSRLEAENAALRHQLTVLQRKIRGRVQFTNTDRVFFIQLYRWCPSVLKAMLIIRPETLVRWHRAGLRHYWRWKSRSAGGRPQIHAELRALIWRMSRHYATRCLHAHTCWSMLEYTGMGAGCLPPTRASILQMQWWAVPLQQKQRCSAQSRPRRWAWARLQRFLQLALSGLGARLPAQGRSRRHLRLCASKQAERHRPRVRRAQAAS
jgi:hypothetical protein